MEGIVYVSASGHTRQYAALLGEKTGLPVYDLAEARKTLPRNAEIIYLGWLMAGKIKGYPKAAKYFTIRALAGVGMASDQSQLVDMKKANAIADDLPLFYLQGGLEVEKLHGIY